MLRTVQMTAQSTNRTGGERRAQARYPLKLPLRYLIRAGKLVSICGEGTTVNISSTGMLFRSSKRLDRAEKVVAAVEWPHKPDGTPVILFFQGHVAWMKGCQIAISVSHYGFLPEEIPTDVREISLDNLVMPRHLTPTRPHSAFDSGVRQWRKGVAQWK